MQFCSCFLILIVILGSRHAAAARKRANRVEQNLRAGRPTIAGTGYLCQDVNRMGGTGEMEVDNFLKQHSLNEEYANLTKALQKTLVALHGGYKGSSLSRTILLAGHDAAFEAKGMKLTLLRSKHFLRWSEYRLCITDASESIPPGFLLVINGEPFKIYGDGLKVRIDCSGRYKRMKPGAVAQATPDGVHVELQVEVLRMLMRKGAMTVQGEFEKDLSSRPQGKWWKGKQNNSAWAQLVTSAYQKRFAQFGLGVFYNRATSHCCCGDKCQSQCRHLRRWFEYVDLEARPYYRPEKHHAYDPVALKHFIRCTSQDSKVQQLVRDSGLSYKSDKSSVARWWKPNCSMVEGAMQRNKPDKTAKCKCPHDQKVYCDSSEIALRKFSEHKLPDCDDPYCSEKPCPGGLP